MRIFQGFFGNKKHTAIFLLRCIIGLFYCEFYVSRVGFDIASSTRSFLRYLDASCVGFCNEGLFGKQYSRNVSRVAFYFKRSAVAVIQLDIAGVAFEVDLT